MFRYANDQIYIYMNINENIRNKGKIIKIRGVHANLSTAAYSPILPAFVPI